MNDKQRGVYQKFIVTRADDKSDPGQKHENCFYFVLDCQHDPHALKALEAYRKSCRRDYPELSADLLKIIMAYPFGSTSQETGNDPL